MRLLHISSDNLDGKILKPSIPSNILTKMGVENNKIKRVSFAPDIPHALLAIGYNRLKSGPKILNIFSPENYNTLKILEPKELDKKDYVPDARKTKEYWVLNNVRVKYVGKIKLIKPTNKFIEVRWGPQKDQVIKNYFWEYKIIDGNIT